MADTAGTPTPDGAAHLPPITAKAILFGNGPRFTRDAFGPVLAFYVLWKLWGLVPGIIAATTVALVGFRYERKRDRPALVVRISLLFVLIQAVVGLWTGSAEIYLAIPVVVSAGTASSSSARPSSGGPSPACSWKRCCRCPTR